MSLNYRIYQNNGAGGPIDYTTVIATVSTLTWTSPALPLNSDYRFAVRAYDTVAALDDGNVDAVVRVTVNGSGADISGLPTAPFGVSVDVLASGSARVLWAYNARGSAAPTGFKIWITAGGTVNYAVAPLATITATATGTKYSTTVTGLTDGVAYTVGVRAVNAVGTESNTTATRGFTARSTGPGNVDALTAVVTSQAGV